jgi:hypothetical protein
LTFAEQTSVRSYPLPDHGTFQLQVPVGWADQMQQPPRRLPPTIKFRQKEGAAFEVLLTPLWAMNGNALPSVQNVRQIVSQSAEGAKTQSVEKTISVVEVKGSSGMGFFFSATDRAPKAGEYKFLTQGIILVGELMVTFTVLTNDNQTDIVADALAMLKSAVHLNET